MSDTEDVTYYCTCSWLGGDPDIGPGRGRKAPTCPACWHHDRKRVLVTTERSTPRAKARAVPTANLATVFERLLKLAQRDHHEGKVGGGSKQPWTAADLVAQEALFEIQTDLLAILLEVAETLGSAMVLRLTEAMPWAYRVRVS